MGGGGGDTAWRRLIFLSKKDTRDKERLTGLTISSFQLKSLLQ